MKKKIIGSIVTLATILLLIASMLSIGGCARESESVAYNISQEADNFNVTRRLEVINARTDKPIFELIGNFSLSNNLNNEGAYADKYRYEVNFLPEMIIPVTFTSND